MIRRLLGILPCAVLLVALVTPGTPLLARTLIVVLFTLTLWDPAMGLLAVAGLAPLGAFIIAMAGIADFRLAELILLSFIAAWLIQPAPVTDGPRLPRYAWAAAWLFAVLLAGLVAGVSRQLLRIPGVLSTNFEAIALHYFGYGDPTGISDAAAMIEGFAIIGAAMELFRRRPSLARSLPLALALSTTVAAAASVLLWFGIGPQTILSREAATGYRFSAHVVDLNAAGSHFAMVLCLALGVAVRERGRRRGVWIAAAAACAVGLWMSRSLSAEAAAGLVIPLAFLWAVTQTWTRARRFALVGAVLGTLLVFGAVRAWQIQRDPTYKGSGMRQQFAMSSFRVIGTHPYFGIGPGRYFRESPNFLAPQLAWSYGSENAHNNYLQIATEAGIIGFFVYAAFFAGALGPAFRAVARNPHDWRLLGAVAGIVAFLGTCLMGHPLLLREVAVAFYLQVAVAASLGGSALLNAASPVGRPFQGRRWNTPIPLWPTVPVLATVAFAVLPAWTLEKPLLPVHLEEVDGMYYADEGMADGVPFHWTRDYGTVYVPKTARTIDLPMRSPIAALSNEPTLVEVSVGGKILINTLVTGTWSNVRLSLPVPEPPLLFTRVSLKINHTARVAQLVPARTADQRIVGVQVGDFRILDVSWEFVPKLAGALAGP